MPASSTVSPRWCADAAAIRPTIARWQLARAGIARVPAQAKCTMCTRGGDGRFTCHSYRRDRETRTPKVDVQWSAIAIVAP